MRLPDTLEFPLFNTRFARAPQVEFERELATHDPAAETKLEEFERVLFHITEALVTLRNGDAIRGLLSFAVTTLSATNPHSPYSFTPAQVRRRLMYLEAGILRCSGRLETAMRLCIHWLHLGTEVYGDEDETLEIKYQNMYRISFAKRPAPHPSNRVGRSKKFVAEHVVNNLSSTFLSTRGVEATIQTVVACAIGVGDYETLQVSKTRAAWPRKRYTRES